MESHSIDPLGRMSLMLDSPLTLQEITNALHELPIDRCPSDDGLFLPFFKTLWDITGSQPLSTFSKALQLVSLSVLVLFVSFQKREIR